MLLDKLIIKGYKMKKNIAYMLLVSIIIQGCGGSDTGGKSSFTTGNQSPLIDAKTSYDIPENQKEAFEIKSTDKTLVSYFIAGEDAADLHVDILTGEVVFREKTDFEKKPMYKITVVVQDKVNNRAEQNVTLNITNIDEATIPVITQTDIRGSFTEAESQKAFTTVWKTDNEGVSNDNQIKIPTIGDGYDYRVDWGDGTMTTGVTADIVHTYATKGIYTVKIDGKFPHLAFSKNRGAASDSKKVISMEHWGEIEWTSMAGAFDGCSNMVGNARDKPNLSKVTNMEYMFVGAAKFNQDIGDWDVSNVTNMLCLLGSAKEFNQDIGAWNVSNVTNMTAIFFGNVKFNQDLTSWDVSNVRDMTKAFYKTSIFNGNIEEWDVSKVTNMSNMFFDAKAFNQDISNWNVSNVTDMSNMFFKASAFNQDLESWDVSSVTNMDGIFTEAIGLDAIPSWVTKK
ncbi:MAG: Chitinase (EC [uncultured Sulfurovum sp.]|uniref:Chitinase (EC) n=1 Tax=uncultured Sulfurovum sp. TaxID=269237 RepID=A0A6S6SWR8_9BACT|nr:MAG: Chitinase (EC [uncultured Sulfurovum sp.]